MKKKICRECGEKFVPENNSQLYCCAECRDQRYERLHPKRRKKSTLAEINEEARKSGMNYGQYVQKMGL